MPKRITGLFEKFIEIESLSGVLLFGATLLALLWANSPFSNIYYDIWDFKLGIEVSKFELIKPLILWINDGLMAIFFFLIGLEIKRELIVGELNTPKKAILPVFAAIGGMSIPALFYFFFHADPATADGWAIPMATDIAFSLAILKLLGKRVPLSLKIFLTAFAIVDDLGAVMIIALFYSSGIKWTLILIAIALVVILYLLFAYTRYSKYLLLLVGVAVWFLFLKAGIHPTIAGVLLAFTVPIRRNVDYRTFSQELQRLTSEMSIPDKPQPARPLNKAQLEEVDLIDDLVNDVHSPLQHLEHSLHNWVAYFIMPIFALANAGVALSGGNALDFQLVSVIAAALVIGNPIGISLLSLLAIRLKITQLSEGMTFRHVIGVSFLAGVGFTMSIFIANLAFAGHPALLESAKMGIMIGSFISGLSGYLILRTASTISAA